MAKKPGDEPRAAKGRRADTSPSPPQPSPPQPPLPAPPSDPPKRSWWEIFKGTPGWVKGLLGFIVLAGGALGVILNYLPAKLELALRQCRPELVRLEATNVGGQTATLGDAEFQMVSTLRFGDRNRHTMDTRALENPIQPSNRAIDRNKAQSYEWLNVFQREEAAEGETCHIYITVPLMNDPDRRYSADCACRAN